MEYDKHLQVLAECCKNVFEDMTATAVVDVKLKPDERGDSDYALAVAIAYEHVDSDVAGQFLLGFASTSMAVTVSSAISENIGLGEVTEFGDDAEEILGEFLNTVVGRALTGWDSLGLPTRFDPPKVLRGSELQSCRPAGAEAYAVILSLDVGHVIFNVTFSKGEAKPLEGKRVLVVDDSKIIRKLLEAALTEAGLQVETAGDGKEAVKVFKSVSPDLTIMDLVMPEMSGLEATEAIRKYDPHAKVLMLTSTSRREKILTAKDLGVVNYLLKPVKIPQLMEAVHDTLG